MMQHQDDVALRQMIAARLSAARAMTDDLFSIVRREAIHERPIPERHRIIFYVGHLEAFDWNLLCRDSLGLASFNPEFDNLFAFGIDPVDGGLPMDQPSDWPPLEDIVRYRTQTRRGLDSQLQKAAFNDPAVRNFRNGWAFNVAIEHRLMHAETLGYMLHWLPYEGKREQPVQPQLVGAPVKRRMVDIPEGTVTLGLDRAAFPTLGWDNEYERHPVKVPAFAIDSHNVTNGDFLSFVRAGGYQERALWQEEGWTWVRENDIRHPRFWLSRNGHWFWRGMFAEFPLPLEWPVYVSHAEASAFARWVSKSLPTEAQFERAAFGSPDGPERTYPWGDAAPASCHGNFDFQRWDPVPAGFHAAGASAFGVADLVGNGWQWTCTAFEPFPGFEPLPFYPGYSANFFDRKHFVMKGGSMLTAAPLLRRTFRNWFQAYYPYVYATFRCVDN